VLLQRMLCGESAPDAALRTSGRIALPGREPPIIDARANTIDQTKSPDPLNRACPAHCTIAQRSAPDSGFEV
jgi:hypothetical protein